MDIPIDISNINIETERLILRPFSQSDLEDFYAYASVPGVGEMAGWPHHQSIETSKTVLQSFVANKDVFALFHKTDRKVIGSLGLHSSWTNEDKQYKNLKAKEIGYVLAKDYWGQGLVPEAVTAVIDYRFENFDVEAFSIGHFVENIQSKRVIEKCGFTFIKKSQYYSKQLNRRYDDMKYIRLLDINRNRVGLLRKVKFLWKIKSNLPRKSFAGQ